MNQVDKGVHAAHCNMGDYLGSCKYGEEDCPELLNDGAGEMTEYEKQLMQEWNRLPQYMKKIGDTYLDIPARDISAFTLAILSCKEYKGKKDLNVVHDMVVLRRNWLNNGYTEEWYNG
jgi:hypothetical protein